MPETPAIFPPPKSVEPGQGGFDLGSGSILPEIPLEVDPSLSAQEYRLRIRQSGIQISSGSEQGAYHAGQTLNQLHSLYPTTLPCMDIHDWPDIPIRGLMLDISRCKVPTMEALFDLVDWMASIKLNQLQLYIEHTFAFPGHDMVWKDASPMTPEEIVSLDAYCRDRYIELVPNLNSFGHMERWLRHAAYKPLAECPDGFYSELHEKQFPHGTTLFPDQQSLEFLEGLYKSYLPHFSSTLFNIGGDEPWELGKGRSGQRVDREGKGRVYLDFLKRIHQLVESNNSTMLCWADILMEHPDLIPELPDDLIPVIWGYDAAHPFDEQCAKVSAHVDQFYVAPGNNTWNSLTGRLDEGLSNMKNAASNALKHGAHGYLITAWGDNGNHQPWITLYPPVLQGACSAWSGELSEAIDLEHYFSNHFFNSDGLARILLQLGRIESILPLPFPNHRSGWSPTHFYLFQEPERLVHKLKEQGSVPTEEQLKSFIRECDLLSTSIPDNLESPIDSLTAREMRLGLSMAQLGTRRAGRLLHGWEDDKWTDDLSQTQKEYHDVWLLRARPGGLEESMGNFTPAP